jgi:hypothetical protein
VFLFGQISLKSRVKTGTTLSSEVDKNGSWEGFEKIFSFFLNIFLTHPVLPYDFCQFVSVLVCFYQERRRDTAFLFGLIYGPSVIVLKRPLHSIKTYPWV